MEDKKIVLQNGLEQCLIKHTIEDIFNSDKTTDSIRETLKVVFALQDLRQALKDDQALQQFKLLQFGLE